MKDIIKQLCDLRYGDSAVYYTGNLAWDIDSLDRQARPDGVSYDLESEAYNALEAIKLAKKTAWDLYELGHVALVQKKIPNTRTFKYIAQGVKK